MRIQKCLSLHVQTKWSLRDPAGRPFLSKSRESDRWSRALGSMSLLMGPVPGLASSNSSAPPGLSLFFARF